MTWPPTYVRSGASSSDLLGEADSEVDLPDMCVTIMCTSTLSIIIGGNNSVMPLLLLLND